MATDSYSLPCGDYDIDGSFKCVCFCYEKKNCICKTNSLGNVSECYEQSYISNRLLDKDDEDDSSDEDDIRRELYYEQEEYHDLNEDFKTFTLNESPIKNNISTEVTDETDEKGNKFRRRRLVVKKEVQEYFMKYYEDTIKKHGNIDGLGIIYYNMFIPVIHENQTYNPMDIISSYKFTEGVVICSYNLINEKPVFIFKYIY